MHDTTHTGSLCEAPSSVAKVRHCVFNVELRRVVNVVRVAGKTYQFIAGLGSPCASRVQSRRRVVVVAVPEGHFPVVTRFACSHSSVPLWGGFVQLQVFDMQCDTPATRQSRWQCDTSQRYFGRCYVQRRYRVSAPYVTLTPRWPRRRGRVNLCCLPQNPRGHPYVCPRSYMSSSLCLSVRLGLEG